MNPPLNDTVVGERAARLQERRDRLALALDRAAWHLGDSGQPPTAMLLADASSYGRELRALLSDGDAAFGGASTEPDQRLSLTEILSGWSRLQNRRRVQALLRRVAGLSHCDQRDHAPLKACQQTAQTLLEQLAQTSAGDWLDLEVGELAAGTHPLVSVLRLADDRDALSDAEWEVHESRVGEAFGRGLATALARGKIALETAVVEEAIPVAPVAGDSGSVMTMSELPAVKTGVNGAPSASLETAAMAAVDTAPAELANDDDGVDQDLGLIFDTPAPPPRLSLNLPEIPESSPAPPVPAVATPARRPAAAPPVPTIVETADEPTLDRVATAVLKLIREERYDFAAHVLATCGDAVPNSRCPVSAALMRTAALSRQLCYPRGEVAARLEEELQSLAWPVHEISDAEDRLGVGLLLRAACLPAALLGASPTATAILRSFAIEAGTSQLYNFCSRVAAFGDRLQGFAAELFQTSSDSEGWHAEDERLRKEVQEWLTSAPSRAVEYARSNPLFVHAHWTITTRTAQREPQLIEEWARWQETLLTAHRLLRPVRDGSSGERNFVKQEVTRIMGLLETPRDIPPRIGSDLRSVIADHEAMRDTLREALEFAHRWLRLQSAAPQRSPTLPSQAVEELRSDLLDRSDQVLVELHDLGRSHSGRWVNVGALACRSAVEFIQRLCSGRQTLPLQEPEIQHILNGILLKVPDLELDLRWRSIADDRESRRRLLDYARVEETSWHEAFELQCAQADHLATLRLLELPVWRNDDERGVLRQQRSQRLEACRRSIREELSDLMTQVHTGKDQSPEMQREAEEWLRRAEALLIAIPRQQTFSRMRSQVDGLRTAWTRMQAGEIRRSQDVDDAQPVRLPGDSKVLSPNNSAAAVVPESSAAEWVF
ncbi:MAG: hypothetical protein SFV23_02690 [Planctomycetaceae bacterium]|nr:hypothetical protein [Planctomycetaceae bacterium]